jgi:hypothetical protein
MDGFDPVVNDSSKAHITRGPNDGPTRGSSDTERHVGAVPFKVIAIPP